MATGTENSPKYSFWANTGSQHPPNQYILLTYIPIRICPASFGMIGCVLCEWRYQMYLPMLMPCLAVILKPKSADAVTTLWNYRRGDISYHKIFREGMSRSRVLGAETGFLVCAWMATDTENSPKYSFWANTGSQHPPNQYILLTYIPMCIRPAIFGTIGYVLSEFQNQTYLPVLMPCYLVTCTGL